MTVSSKTTSEAVKHSVVRSEQRKDWALWIIAGGGVAMTLYAIAALVLVSAYPHFVYWLGVLSMANILVLFGAIAGLLVKRTISLSKTGLTMEDHDTTDK